MTNNFLADEMHSKMAEVVDSSLLSAGYSVPDISFHAASTNFWRRPESMWMEYMFEWNPLLAEAEAVEACEWLREAGFPQYAQMYKDNRFPIDLRAAERDHDFLDQDALQAVFRRLDVLNKCSSSKFKRSPDPLKKNNFGSDDDEECALSNKWKFQRNSRIWSRIEAEFLPHLNTQPDAVSFNDSLQSTSSLDSIFCEILQQPPASETEVDEPRVTTPLTDGQRSEVVTPVVSSGNSDFVTAEQNLVETVENKNAKRLKRPKLFLPSRTFDSENETEIFCNGKALDTLNADIEDVFLTDSGLPSNDKSCSFPVLTRHLSDSETSGINSGSLSPSFQRTASDKFRGAFGLFRRMEGFKIRRSLRKLSKGELKKSDIGSPVLIESPEILSKLDSLNCTDISQVTDNSKDIEKPVTKPLNLQAPVISTPASQITKDSKDIPQISKNNCDGKSARLQPLTRFEFGEEEKTLTNGALSIENAFTIAPTKDIYKRSHSLDTETKHLEEAAAIIAELLKGIDTEIASSSKNSKRISVYDNVSGSAPQATSDLQNELDSLLNELYKSIDSLNCPVRKAGADRRDSPTSSLCTLDEEDPNKPSGTTRKNQSVLDPPGTCDSTDGNVSTTPSEGSYYLDQALLECTNKSNPTVDIFSDETTQTDSTIKDDQIPVAEVGDPLPGAPLEIPSDPDSSGSAEQKEDDWSYPVGEEGGGRERRDSGVGSSLTRTASSKRQKRPRLRWHSFARSHQMILNGCDQPINNLSAGQLAVLRKLSLLKVTAALEKYSPANRAHWSWFVPRLKRRTKMPDYSDRNVFAIPIAVTQQRYNQPLPQCILYLMRCLRRTANESVGIFRKSGVRSRVQALRIALESDPDAVDFDGLHSYDVADLLKLYFRELPECLLTNKLSHVFISVFLYVPVHLRHDLIRSALLLLPDELRLTLQSLLLFLGDMAQHSESNQMNASNLAVCFAPSLFHLCCAKSGRASSPKQIQKRPIMPSDKDLMEQKIAHECLTYMIANAKQIFTVPEEMLSTCQLSYLEQGDPVPLEDLCRKYGKCDGSDYSSYVDSCIKGVLKESRDRFKGWISQSLPSGDVDLAYKKVGDGHPLRLWKFCVDVEAPPEEVLNRVLRERHLWDDDILKWRIVEKLDSHTEVFQYVLNTMVPHPTRDFSELRSWRTDLPRGMCILISTSVEHVNAPLMGDVRGVVLASRYLIEPCGSGKSRLTHIIRIDLRGYSTEWYNNIYGHICANYARRIRDSFKTRIALACGPETKV